MAVLAGVMVRVCVYVIVFSGVFVRVYVYVAVFTGVFVLVRVYVGVGTLTVGVLDGVRVGVMTTDVKNATLSTCISSAPLPLLVHCRATTAFSAKGPVSEPKPLFPSEAWSIGTVTFVHVAGATNATP